MEKIIRFILTEHRKSLIFLFFLSLFVRLFALIAIPDLTFPDSETYLESGQQLLEKGIIESNRVMPLYPLLVDFFGGLGQIKYFDIFLSSITSIILAKIGLIVFEDRVKGFVAGFIFSIYPFSIFYSISSLTETLFTFLFLASVYFFYRQKVNLGVILLVISILVRPVLDLFAIVMILSFLVVYKRLNTKSFLKLVVSYLFIYSVIMSPWWFHNYNKYGSFVRLNLGDGFVLYSGNNILNKTGGGIVFVDFDPSEHNKIKDPVLRNEKFKEDAFNFIKENPARFLDLAVKKFMKFWRITPYAKEYQETKYIIISIFSYGIILLFSFIYFFKAKYYEAIKVLPLILLCIYLTFVHMITISSIRYRYPLEPILILFATGGFFKSNFVQRFVKNIIKNE